jgi:uncharacterized protein YaeQ
MTFIDGIFNFTIEICRVEEHIYDTAKVRVSRHEAEGIELFYARLLAYSHSYSAELLLSPDATDLKTPHLYSHCPNGDFLFWAKVGETSAKEVRHARRASKLTTIRVYFFKDEHVQHFCNEMRGSKENWIADVEFFRIPVSTIHWIASFERARSKWQVTFTERNQGYLSVGEDFHETLIEELDMWAQYQLHLDQRSSSAG